MHIHKLLTFLDILLTSAKNCKEDTTFDNLITQEEDMKARLMILFINFFPSPNCLGTSFLHLKIVKIHFPKVSLWSILVSVIPEF